MCVCVHIYIYICYLIFSTGPHLNLSSYPNLSDHGSVWHGLIYWCSLVTRIKSQCINELYNLILYLSCTYILHIIGEKLPSFLYWLSMSRRLCVVPSYKLCNTVSLQKMCSWFVLLKVWWFCRVELVVDKSWTPLLCLSCTWEIYLNCTMRNMRGLCNKMLESLR